MNTSGFESVTMNQPFQTSYPHGVYMTQSHVDGFNSVYHNNTGSNNRDPQMSEFWKTKICMSWLAHNCTQGANCRYAHGKSELRQIPSGTSVTHRSKNSKKGDNNPLGLNTAKLIRIRKAEFSRRPASPLELSPMSMPIPQNISVIPHLNGVNPGIMPTQSTNGDMSSMMNMAQMNVSFVDAASQGHLIHAMNQNDQIHGMNSLVHNNNINYTLPVNAGFMVNNNQQQFSIPMVTGGNPMLVQQQLMKNDRAITHNNSSFIHTNGDLRMNMNLNQQNVYMQQQQFVPDHQPLFTMPAPSHLPNQVYFQQVQQQQLQQQQVQQQQIFTSTMSPQHHNLVLQPEVGSYQEASSSNSNMILNNINNISADNNKNGYTSSSTTATSSPPGAVEQKARISYSEEFVNNNIDNFSSYVHHPSQNNFSTTANTALNTNFHNNSVMNNFSTSNVDRLSNSTSQIVHHDNSGNYPVILGNNSAGSLNIGSRNDNSQMSVFKNSTSKALNSHDSFQQDGGVSGQENTMLNNFYQVQHPQNYRSYPSYSSSSSSSSSVSSLSHQQRPSY